MCKRLFYLESVDYIDDLVFTVVDDAGAAQPEDATTTAEEPTADALIVSMHALAGIRTENMMLLHMTLKGEHLLALLDTGSTHTFLQCAVMHRFELTPIGVESLRVTVASGERLQCKGIAHDIPISFGEAAYPVTRRSNLHRRGGVPRHLRRPHAGLLRLHPRRRLPSHPGAPALGFQCPHDVFPARWLPYHLAV